MSRRILLATLYRVLGDKGGDVPARELCGVRILLRLVWVRVARLDRRVVPVPVDLRVSCFRVVPEQQSPQLVLSRRKRIAVIEVPLRERQPQRLINEMQV